MDSTPQVRVDESVEAQPAQSAPSDQTVQLSQDATASAVTEVEMGGTQEDATSDVQEVAAPAPAPVKKPTSINYIDFLTSSIVEIIVGQGDKETSMKAHQTLLMQAPFFAELVDKLEEPRRIDLPEEDVDAFTHFLQFLYTRDYIIPESDAGASEADKSEENMLHHARTYTLAEKLGLPALKNLAHGKIHKIKGTPAAELAYARYVYTHTPADDTAIRRPVASHWANQSHALRHEVGDDFQKLCIEVPQFSFDVLSIILDRKEKSNAHDDIKGSARKRTRREI
ncbi:unnamed protein product [Penicillium salamii]|uniref:BTB domain-containing protein n=1 Tax=Penicillium salamii TaxID=1612424 RepID=A0A9W4I2Z1_9EURO|nr:unnamed protein product [Penicillium salamii]